jgi:hypothetical protein
MNKPLRVYVAGPYSAKTPDTHAAVQEVARNVDRAVEVAVHLIEKGHYPFVPHLSHYVHTSPHCKRDYGAWYYELDNTFLDYWAEALFYVAPSPGADAELERAKKLGLKVFRGIGEVPDAKRVRLLGEDVPFST